MATSNPDVVDKLKDIVTCAVCYKLLEKPHTFRCLHTVCESCLEQIQPITEQHGYGPISDDEGYRCPVCRTFSPTKDIKVETFLLKDMLEVYNLAISEKGSRMCSKCKVEKPTHRCLNCKDDLCTVCKSFHDQFELMRVHKSIELDGSVHDYAIDKLVFCTEHPDKQVELHCKECDVCMCVICKVIEHDGHASETADKALQRLLPHFNMLQSQVNTRMHEASDNLETTAEHTRDIQQEIEQLQQKVQHEFDAKQTQLESEKQNLMAELETLKEIKQKECSNVCKKLENMMQEQKQVLAWFDGTVSTTSGVCLLKHLHGHVGQRIQSLAKEKEEIPNKHNIEPLDVTFHASGNESTPIIGQLVKPKKNELNLTPRVYDDAFADVKPKSGTFPEYKQQPEVVPRMKQFEPEMKPGMEQEESEEDSVSLDESELDLGLVRESHMFNFPLHRLHTRAPVKQETITINFKAHARPLQNFSIIDGRFWLVSMNSKYIRIFDSYGSFVEEKVLRGVFSPRALVALSDKHIAVAAQSGVSVISTGNMKVEKLTSWKCNSICVSAGVLYALDYQNTFVCSFTYDDQSESWTQKNLLPLTGVNHTGPKDGDQIIVDNGYVYLSVENGSQITQYDLDGRLLKRFEENCSCISKPRVCGKDAGGLILVCNRGDGLLYFLNPRKGSMSRINVSAEAGELKYAAPGPDNKLWILTGANLFHRYSLQ